ncbi:cyclic pyranopterin monophosphate synthase [bacterium BMS3Abin01]|nr:cyclic pyranopterin monophosphate synthase [bacterium BMS3Abin01]
MKHYLQSAMNYVARTRPFETTVFLTSSCNFRCDHCFYWNELNRKEELTLEEFRLLAQSMPTLERFQFTGGEPFLRKDIDEIIAEFYRCSRPMYITIPTNGYLTNTIIEKTESIMKMAPDCFVNISLQLNDLGEKRDESVKVKGSFDHLVNTARELNILKTKFPNLGLTVICIQTAANQHRVRQIYDFAQDEFEVDNFAYSVVRGNPKKPDVKNIDPRIYHQMCNHLLESYKEKSADSKIPLYRLFLTNRELVYDYTYRTLVQDSYQIKCYAGILRAVILENGDVYPCEILMEHGDEYSLGNLRDFDMDFMRLWKSEKRKEITRRIAEQKCFCTHGCDMMVNTMFNKKFPFLVMRKLIS